MEMKRILKQIIMHIIKSPLYLIYIGIFVTVMLWGIGAAALEKAFLGTPEQQARESYEASLF